MIDDLQITRSRPFDKFRVSAGLNFERSREMSLAANRRGEDVSETRVNFICIVRESFTRKDTKIRSNTIFTKSFAKGRICPPLIFFVIYLLPVDKFLFCHRALDPRCPENLRTCLGKASRCYRAAELWLPGSMTALNDRNWSNQKGPESVGGINGRPFKPGRMR